MLINVIFTKKNFIILLINNKKVSLSILKICKIIILYKNKNYLLSLFVNL
jgi:hypothetical protein